MNRIVDSAGVLFHPNAGYGDIPWRIGKHWLEEFSRPAVFESTLRIQQLRESCGAEPEARTVKFRRYEALPEPKP